MSRVRTAILGEHLRRSARLSDGAPRIPLEGFWRSRVQSIQTARTGVPWLDAIVDSAIDVDKIEYVFHDSRLTGQNVRLAGLTSWMSDFLIGQSLTPEGLIRLEGESALAAMALLEERMYLYRRLYLSPELRGLEAMVRYIVTTWLTWKVPQRLDARAAAATGDWRSLKGAAAGKALWDILETESKDTRENELKAAGKMVKQLRGMKENGDERAPWLDETALEWLDQLWGTLQPFVENTQSPTGPSMEVAREVFSRLAPIGPLYAHASEEETIRKVARRWRVHSPLLAIVDVASFPRFLSTPRARATRSIIPTEIVAEQFLVPGERPSEWRIRKKATIPIHTCDFSAFELPVVQIVVLDPWGASSAGSSFLHQMLRRELRNANVELFESPDAAAEAHKAT